MFDDHFPDEGENQDFFFFFFQWGVMQWSCTFFFSDTEN